MAEEPRNFTDADISQLLKGLIVPVSVEIRRQLVEEFELDLGRTVFRWLKRAAISTVVFVVLWGIAHFGPDAASHPIPRHR